MTCRCLTETPFLSLFTPFSTLDPCLSSDLNSLLPMADLEDFLSPLPEPSASGSVALQLSLGIPCEFPKRPWFVVSFLILAACRIYKQVVYCKLAICFDALHFIYHISRPEGFNPFCIQCSHTRLFRQFPETLLIIVPYVCFCSPLFSCLP